MTLLLIAVGSLAGILAGLLGIGGGLVIVPALTLMLQSRGVSLELAVPIAVATSLGSMLLTSASAIWFHNRRAVVDWPCVKRLAPAVGLGAIVGALVAVMVSGQMLARVFAVLAALIGLRMILASDLPRRSRPPYPRGWWSAGPLIGALSAMIGIGGGSFNVPYLTWNGYSPVSAVAIASSCGWLIALGGFATFALFSPGQTTWAATLGHVYLPGMLIIGLTGAITAPAGVALAHWLPAPMLRRIFGIALVLVAIRMIW